MDDRFLALEFLKSLADKHYEINHIDAAIDVMLEILKMESAQVPTIMLTSDGAIQMSWTKNGLHLSIDLYCDSYDWFVRDRNSGAYTGGYSDRFSICAELRAILATLFKGYQEDE